MEVRPAYKQTDVGVIPEDWGVFRLDSLGAGSVPPIKAGPFGSSLTKDNYVATGFKVYGQEQVIRGDYLYGDYFISARRYRELESCAVRPGDILLSLVGTVGRLLEIPDGAPAGIINPRVIRFSFDKDRVFPRFFRYLFEADSVQLLLERRAQGGTMGILNAGVLRPFCIPLPPVGEQRAIAEALSDVDALLGALDTAFVKKRDVRHATMQELLTGQTRLPGFSGEWQVKQIAEIATPSSERNVAGKNMPVLTCSKHLGFVDSLAYFKNQVFSQDLSTYKIIRRREIGYPANHIEEGSIGLQTLYDVALVSPIYVVFSVADSINSYFLHRLLKLHSYRQRFKTATSSSVDRRGSLRWPVFSEITVSLPPLPEQNAIAEVLLDMDAEISALEARRDKTRSLKQAMMQELLTGRTRVV